MMNRKTFLKTLAAGTLGATMAPTAWASPYSRSGPLKNWAWVRGDFGTMAPWKAKFARWKAAGIDAILPEVKSPETLARIVRAAGDEGLEVHAWVVTMMQGGFEAKHPEWYAVNRNGASTAEHPPYVAYYKFLCPCRASVRDYLARYIASFAQVDGVRSIHLDYIRYPDVILPIALWPKYNLVQDREYPEYDYCYCAECRAQFAAKTGLDPLSLAHPSANDAWRQFRYDSITRVVHRLAEVAHAANRQLTAAVFPTPAIARRLVRQNWPKWPLDAVLPMLYHNFYNEPVSWLEGATREGVQALGGRIPLYAGLFVPALDPDALAEAARRTLAGGAAGIALFEAQAPTAAHWQKLKPVLQS